MRIVITGGAGFLGQRLARRLLHLGQLIGRDGASQPIERLTLVDVVAPAGVPRDPRLEHLVGDISDRAFLERAIGPDVDSVFHLAAIVSGMAEAEFDTGMRVNVDATRLLLDLCRARQTCPRVVFSSSVAVYGGPLPALVLDTTALTPQTSYGAQKAIGELLVNDYSRKGFIDGRVLRLPTVCVRPGKPNAAASSFASGIIREPLNGEESICPVSPDTLMWLISPSAVTGCFVKAHELPGDAFGATRTVNLPGLSITIRDMVAALEQVAGLEVVSRIRWTIDPRIARIVATWPGALDNARALSLGFPHDEDFASVVRTHIAEMDTRQT